MRKEKSICSVMLVVLGENLDPDKVTTRFNLMPTEVWRKGERDSYVHKDGTVHFLKTVNERGGWKMWFDDERKELPLIEQIKLWCQMLSIHQKNIIEMKSQGNKFILDCFIAEDGIKTVSIETSILSQLSELFLDLEITFSPV